MIRRPPRSTQSRSSAASDVYKRQIIHHTEQNSCEQTLQTFTLPRTQVSAHYVICKDGTIHHMLNDYLRAWHAGNSRWGNLTDVNSSSIGIEIDNNGFEPFAEAQINSLVTLLSYPV